MEAKKKRIEGPKEGVLRFPLFLKGVEGHLLKEGRAGGAGQIAYK